MFVFFCNVYSLFLWIFRLSSYREQYDFVHVRLARTSRPEIPRFRFNFEHVHRNLGDHVHRTLIDSFLTRYLELDGYFFIQILTANVSDFIVQEIVEQLWVIYITKYGEADAIHGEKTYFELHDQALKLKLQINRKRKFWSTISNSYENQRRSSNSHIFQSINEEKKEFV